MIPTIYLKSILETDDEKYCRISWSEEKDEQYFDSSQWKYWYLESSLCNKCRR